MSSEMPPPPQARPKVFVPADWYIVGDVMRYWDGDAWTEHTAPLPPAHMTQQPMQAQVPMHHQQQQAPTGPLMNFTSHIAGKNANVTIYADRIEWVKSGMMGGTKGSEMVPMRSVSSVTSRKDGMVNTVVQVATSGGMIEMRCSHGLAEQVRRCIMDQTLR